MRPHDRLALGNGQGVENPRGSVTVFFECAEERRPVALSNTMQQTQVQLQNALAGMEYPAEVCAEPARHVLDLDLGHQVEVEFGSQTTQCAGQDLRAFLG